MNPKRPVAEALFAALAGQLLDEAEAVVPVYEHVPADYAGGAYVLLSQYAATEEPAPACRGQEPPPRWRVSVLADALTPFAGEVSTTPGDLLSEQLQARARNLAGQPLPEGYSVDRVTVERTDGFGEDGPDARWLHNTSRLVFLISY